jgi:choline dehydrogenase
VRRGSPDGLGAAPSLFVEAALAAGFRWDSDANGVDTGGVGLVPMNSIGGVRQNAGAAFLDRTVVRPNLSLLDRTRVNRILIEKGRTVGVEVGERNRLRAVTAGR